MSNNSNTAAADTNKRLPTYIRRTETGVTIHGMAFDITPDGHVWGVNAPAAFVRRLREHGFKVRC